MMYAKSAQLFCTTTEKVTDITNAYWHTAADDYPHPMDRITNTPLPPTDDIAVG